MRFRPLAVSLVFLGSASGILADTPLTTQAAPGTAISSPNILPASSLRNKPLPPPSKTPAPVPATSAPSAPEGPVDPHNAAAYNDPAALKAKIAELQTELAEMTHPSPAQPTADWYKRIHIGGLVSMDVDHWSKPNFGVGPYNHSQSTYLELAPAVLTADAQATNWASGHVGMIYMNGSSPSVRNFSPSKNVNRNLNLEQAYITIGDFSKLPYYLRVGEQYAPFGYYELYPITQSLTQILSEMEEPTIEGGFVSPQGFSGAAYALAGENEINHSDSDSINNFGLHLGYQNFHHPLAYDLGLDYLRNMGDVDSIRQVINHNGGYTKSVPALSAHGDLYFGPFSLGAQYVTATQKFAAKDYEWLNHGRVQGAKPSALGVDTGYKFNLKGHRSLLDLGYQYSYYAFNSSPSVVQSSATQLAKYQWLATWGVNVVKNLMTELQFVRSRDYSPAYGGTGHFNNTVTLRLSLVF